MRMLALLVCVSFTAICMGQKPPKATPVPGPMLQQGFLTLNTPDFVLTLVKSSQTVAALKPKGSAGFDFTPGGILVQRSQDGYYHLGDLDLRLRSSATEPWKGYSTAHERHPVLALQTSGSVLAAADLAPTLPSDIPLHIVRQWVTTDGKLGLRFTITNRSSHPVEIGSLGIPMIFNNVITGHTLEQAHEICSFSDPYIGEDAGYLQVTRLNGHGPALVVAPDGQTPFEAYNPILNNRGPDHKIEIFNDPTPRSMTFEGFYEWMAHSGAYQQNEWMQAPPWNTATRFTLKPGESRVYGVKFLVSDSIRNIEKMLAENHRPVAVGVPGYILPQDIQGHLFLKYPQKVRSVSVEPEGAISFVKQKPSPGGWQDYLLEGKTWGRARVSITYADGLLQTINYMVIKPEAEAVADLGHFLTTKEWFVDPNDPFKRSPSPMSYDREANSIVTQESRVWIAGLSDEAGAGPWVAAAMKEFGEPNKQEIEKYEQFVDGVLWGQLQTKDGPGQYGVRKSLFYYQPDKFPPNYYRSDFNWKSWTSWNQKQSEDLGRSFNYPHVAAAYWALYRLSRNHPGLVTNHPWQWYLDHAYETTMAMMKDAPYYTRFGQMEGDVFVAILKDLKSEGMTESAARMEAAMHGRAERWSKEAYPFGSEMPWDSTGQEEVYAWTKYFGYQDKAEVTLNAILGYDPAIPSWGYNGSARRFWDFLYGGKYPRLERQLHHYGSGINAIPLLAEYRDHPDDLYLLRVGYGGTMGELSNIDQEGFASAAFHAFPDKLAFDPYTGDYGPGFFGHAWNTATYLTEDPQLGWIAFGGNFQKKGNSVFVTTLDSFRNRLYIAPLGLWLTLDAGKFERAEFNLQTRTVELTFAGATEFTPSARLRIEQPAKISGVGVYKLVGAFKSERGASTIPLKPGSTKVVLRQN